jgi:hypothetical protein
MIGFVMSCQLHGATLGALDGFFFFKFHVGWVGGGGILKSLKTSNMLKIGQEQLFYLRCVSLSVLVTGIVMAAVHNDGY